MSDPTSLSSPAKNKLGASSSFELKAFVARIEERVEHYLHPRSDDEEQRDHLRHVADRTRWLYYSELQRENPGASVRISSHEDMLIEACVLSHDIGKWIPRDELQALIPLSPAAVEATFQELKFTSDQSELFLLGVRRRFALERDGYVPEYDSAHHLVSAYLLAADASLGFHKLEAGDRERLINMIVGHQFGSYFKESLLHLSMEDAEVTTGMLMDITTPDRVIGDLLACSFHDADISDLLFVGSLERRPNREEIFHTGGLVKILMINFTNLINHTPRAPADLNECLRSCQATVNSVCKEFITPTAIKHGHRWRRQARRFLAILREKSVFEKISSILDSQGKPAAESVAAARIITHMQARSFLKGPEEE
jgi:hypothetical protein